MDEMRIKKTTRKPAKETRKMAPDKSAVPTPGNRKWYACHSRWCVDDIKARAMGVYTPFEKVADNAEEGEVDGELHLRITDAEARDFLDSYEDSIQDAMTVAGWEVVEVFLPEYLESLKRKRSAVTKPRLKK